MVAVLSDDPIYRLPPADEFEHPIAHTVEPSLRSIRGGRSDSTVETEAEDELSFFSGRNLLVSVCVAFALSFALLSLQGAASDGSTVRAGTSRPVAGESVVIVQPGDTLWSLAQSLAPEADRRTVVQALADRNGGSTIFAGQRLVVPEGL